MLDEADEMLEMGFIEDIEAILRKAEKEPLFGSQVSMIREAVAHYQPWLEWAGKQEQYEKGWFEVDPVALHIHERVSAQAIVRTAMREDVQRGLFADPEQSYQQAVQFYRHSVDWANRLILGDSLQVMSSLVRRENLAGKVQMIFMDPPYGIKFASNFQSELGRRDVKEKDADLSREAETVHAFRDTWHLGLHSYCGYLSERISVARDLLSDSGSIFVQIGEANIHRVRCLLDQLFGEENFVCQIAFAKTTATSASLLPTTGDFLLWYAKDRQKVKYRQCYLQKSNALASYNLAEYRATGELRKLALSEVKDWSSLPDGWSILSAQNLRSQGVRANTTGSFQYQGRSFHSGASHNWKTTMDGLDRLIGADRLVLSGTLPNYKRFVTDFPVVPVSDNWDDTAIAGFSGEDKVYVVQTATKVIERCLLMTTDPGDLVLDPTCGSGTTAAVAEQWGRRWIGIDTSRVAVSIARQRLLTAKFEHFRTKGGGEGPSENPGSGFKYRTVSHITLRSIAQNANLDPIVRRHDLGLEKCLASCNSALKEVAAPLREGLAAKLRAKSGKETSEADRRRWRLPPDNRDRSAAAKKGSIVDLDARCWYHWEVPFDVDSDWPKSLQDAVSMYRKAWRAKMEEVDASVAANADQEELVDQPEVVKGIIRVSGPFTVEGVRPEELSLGEDGLFDPTPNEFDDELGGMDPRIVNLQAYLSKLVSSLRGDGVTFLGNNQRKFARVEPLFETATGSVIHAEGVWEDGDASGPATVGVTFGPQYGPVTATQVEDAIRSARRYDDLVVAGFSFDAEASAAIQESAHPKLRIHQAHIRPDMNPAMDGLLKETPGSQLFTVFGQPEVEVRKTKEGEFVCELSGVDIYDPIENTVRSSGAEKVAAWFLDQDYDGRCFCITQAFFPDQDAWEKIAKALKGSADPEAFDAFKGTISLPFSVGKHRRIAVKVIDPRGNEVMAIRKLEG